MRGVRGAITVNENSAEEIKTATKELLRTILEENALTPDDIISAIFTVTPDLDAAFPAASAREIGWARVPLLCSTEIPVPGAMPRCIRVMLHVETEKKQQEIRHVYLREAMKLRDDL